VRPLVVHIANEMNDWFLADGTTDDEDENEDKGMITGFSTLRILGWLSR
jgi:hypothetical protein